MTALSHTADGTTPAQRIASAGYRYCQVGENLASILDTRGFTADEYARRAVQGWENSPGHRHNMLLEHVTETGVGVVRSSPSVPKYIAVQLFARPGGDEIQLQDNQWGGEGCGLHVQRQGQQRRRRARSSPIRPACPAAQLCRRAQRTSPRRATKRATVRFIRSRRPASGIAVEVAAGTAPQLSGRPRGAGSDP